MNIYQHTQRTPKQEPTELSPLTEPHPGPYRRVSKKEVLEGKGFRKKILAIHSITRGLFLTHTYYCLQKVIYF